MAKNRTSLLFYSSTFTSVKDLNRYFYFHQSTFFFTQVHILLLNGTEWEYFHHLCVQSIQCELDEHVAISSFSFAKVQTDENLSPLYCKVSPFEWLLLLRRGFSADTKWQHVVAFSFFCLCGCNKWAGPGFHPVAAAIPHGCCSRDYHGDNPRVKGSVPEVGPPTTPAAPPGARLLLSGDHCLPPQQF